MESKEWYKSKTIWTAIIGLIVAASTQFGLNLTADQLMVVLTVFLSLIGINLRLAAK